MYRNYLISISELSRLQKSNACLYDLRSRTEFNQFHLAGFLNYPASEYPSWVPFLPSKKPLYFLCTHGSTAITIVQSLIAQNYQAYAFNGGLEAYLYFNKTNKDYF